MALTTSDPASNVASHAAGCNASPPTTRENSHRSEESPQDEASQRTEPGASDLANPPPTIASRELHDLAGLKARRLSWSKLSVATTEKAPVRRSPSLRLPKGPRSVPLPGQSVLTSDTKRNAFADQYKSVLEVQRFEQMMDRFQLRRVISDPQRGRLPGASSRTLSRRSSSDNGVEVAKPPSRFSPRRASAWARIAVVDEGDASVHDAQPMAFCPQPSPTVPELPLAEGPSKDRTTVTVQTCHPTSVATRIRLSLLVLAFAGKLMYMPYDIAYYAHHTGSISLDAVVDVVFVANILATCNTATHNNRGQAITTRSAIWHHYRQNGFLMDMLAAIPFECALIFTSHLSAAHWVVGLLKISIQFVGVYRHIAKFYAALAKQVIGADKSVVAWLFYSRYSHLVRIGGIVVMILLLAHYFACMWSWLHSGIDPAFFGTAEPLTVHMRSIYEALQLLQGQGMETKTLPQALFGSVAVLLGSIALAVVFGHVAILVANFSANNTAYQRKMERVFAVMGKLQLPHPVRERVHQYYEYLHTEYESLDGDVVKFAKDLSHTLELEVGLFKYMDVLVRVPHWRDCSPDFQKQLVLNLSVRVYLPDDFVMRRGEVGTECYIINRGTCKLCEYPTGNCEPPTAAIGSDHNRPGKLRSRRSGLSARTPRRQPSKSNLGPSGPSRYSVHNQSHSELDDMSKYSRVIELTQGQGVGEIALLANYERSSDLRAVTYVEMCVVTRDAFQRILTRYPRDRELALGSIVRNTMLHLEANKMPCVLMKMAREASPNVSTLDAIQLVTRAMNPPLNDPSIVFGATANLSTRLKEQVARINTVGRQQWAEEKETSTSSCSQPAPSSGNPVLNKTETSLDVEENILGLLQDIRDRLTRLESQQRVPPDARHTIVRSCTSPK